MKFLKKIIARKFGPPNDGFYASQQLAEDDSEDDFALAPNTDVFDDLPNLQSEHADFDISELLTREERISKASDGIAPETAGEGDGLIIVQQAGEDSDQGDEIFDILGVLENCCTAADEPSILEAPSKPERELASQEMAAMVTSPCVSSFTPKTEEASILTGGETRHAPNSGHVKTRILGFSDFEPKRKEKKDDVWRNEEAPFGHFPVGWLLVIEGPGYGSSFTLRNWVSNIGRGDGQTIRLDFGDTSISRETHSTIAYDEDLNAFFIGHGGKINLVRLNGRPLISTEELTSGDLIRIGETTLRFVEFCSKDFAWDLTDDEEIVHARVG